MTIVNLSPDDCDAVALHTSQTDQLLMGDFISQVATRRAKSEDRNSNEDVSNAHNRRELPSRRQAYRYYFKLKLSSDPAGPKVEEIKEEVAPCSVPPGPGMPASIYQTNHGQFSKSHWKGDMYLTHLSL
uniref:Uncharacterized protein n=1 Tax=Oncorhynchus mykiss TaxID=8022 RepID=A0A8K9V4D0_ONCMY